MGRQRRKLIGMRAKGQSCQCCDLCCRALGELRMRIQARAHRGPPDRKLIEALERRFHAGDIAREHARPPANLLAERERRCILQVRASDLDDVLELLCLRRDRIMQTLHCRNELLFHTDAEAMYIAVGNVSFDDCDMFT
jgi:hypothetical protein